MEMTISSRVVTGECPVCQAEKEVETWPGSYLDADAFVCLDCYSTWQMRERAALEMKKSAIKKRK